MVYPAGRGSRCPVVLVIEQALRPIPAGTPFRDALAVIENALEVEATRCENFDQRGQASFMADAADMVRQLARRCV